MPLSRRLPHALAITAALAMSAAPAHAQLPAGYTPLVGGIPTMLLDDFFIGPVRVTYGDIANGYADMSVRFEQGQRRDTGKWYLRGYAVARPGQELLNLREHPDLVSTFASLDLATLYGDGSGSEGWMLENVGFSMMDLTGTSPLQSFTIAHPLNEVGGGPGIPWRSFPSAPTRISYFAYLEMTDSEGNTFSEAWDETDLPFTLGPTVETGVAAVPEPSTLALLAGGVLVLAGAARRRPQA